MIHTNELMYMSLCYTPWADNLAFGTQAKCKTLYMCLTQWGGVTDRPCAPSTDFHLSLKAHRDFPCRMAFWHRVGWVSEYYLEMLSQLKCFYTQPLYCVDPKGKICMSEGVCNVTHVHVINSLGYNRNHFGRIHRMMRGSPERRPPASAGATTCLCDS